MKTKVYAAVIVFSLLLSGVIVADGAEVTDGDENVGEEVEGSEAEHVSPESESLTQDGPTEIYDWHDLDDIRDNTDGDGNVIGDYVLMSDLDEDTAGYSDYNEQTEDYSVKHVKADGDWEAGDTVDLHYDEDKYGSILSVEDDHDNSIDYSKDNNQITLEEDVGDDIVVITYEDAVVGWSPIGEIGEPFTGTFDGDVHEISDLYIDRADKSAVALFGVLDEAEVTDLGVADATVTGGGPDKEHVGVLAGNNAGTVNNSYATGNVTGMPRTDSGVGGLVGTNFDRWDEGNEVRNSYAIVDVSGGTRVGGLVGYNWDAPIYNSYSTGEVTGEDDVGGLVGRGGGVSDSFWDTETSGQDESAGGTGKTTAEMKDVATYTDTNTGGLEEPWDFVDNPNEDEGDEDIWHIDEDEEINEGHPFFFWEIQRRLTIHIEGNGSVKVEDQDVEDGWSGRFVEDEKVNLTAVPDEYWYLDEWTGDHTGTEEEVNITMDEHKEITVHFEELDEYNLEIEIEGEGSTDPPEGIYTYYDGEVVNITAEPEEGWYFDEWTGEVPDGEKGQEINITMDEDKNITAHFEEYVNLTIEIEGKGGVEVNGEEVDDGWNETFEEDEEVTLTAVPDDYSYFVNWTGDYEGTEEEISITMDEDKTITAHFEMYVNLTIEIEGNGSVEINGEEVDDGGNETFEEGEEVNLTAVPDEHWYFVNWTGDHESTDEEINITMDENKSVTAWFEEHNYTLEVSVEGGGSVDIDPNKEEYDPNDKVNLTAYPAEGWYFKEWTGDAAGTDETINITMDGNKNITAHFEEYVNLTIEIEGEGTVEIDPDEDRYEQGTEVTLTADPAEGWYFKEWTGDAVGTDETMDITMDENKSITAHFEEYVNLTIEIEGEGTVKVNEEEVDDGWNGSFEKDEKVNLTAVPDEHWYFVNWTGDYTGEEEEINITMDENKSVTAWFEEHNYTLEMNIEGEGSVEIDPDKPVYEPNEVVNLTAVPDGHWYFVNWTGDYEGDEEEINITMDESKSITAWFEEHNYTLEVNVEGEGSVDIEPDKPVYEPNEVVNLTALPGEHWYFVNWTGDYESTEEEINITMDEDKELTATFEEYRYTLNVTIEGEGSVEIDPNEEEYNPNEEVELTAVPDDYWYFDRWTGDHEGEEEEEITIVMDGDKSVTAWFEEHAYTLDVSVEGGGSVEVEPDKEEYEHGVEVTITAVSGEHWYFVEWTGDVPEGEEGEEITIVMDGDKSVTAWFEKHTYTLDVSVEGEGSVEVEPDQDEYEYGVGVTIRADPDKHWYFDRWAGDHGGEEKEITITMDGDKSVTAWFEEHTYTLNLTIEGEGRVYMEPDKRAYEPNEQVELTAIPDEHWYFVEWTGDVPEVEEGEDITIVMDEDKNITAHFERYVQLTIEIEGEGSVEVEPEQDRYEQGVEVDLTAEPEAGWYFVEWMGDVSEDEGGEEDISIVMDDDKEVTVWFSDDTYDLTISIIGEGSIDPEKGSHPYRPGEEVTIEATADEGWYFDEWIGTAETGEQITLTMDGDKSLTARFVAYEPGYFDVEIINYDETVGKGEEFIIEYEVKNSGELEGTQDIVLKRDDEEVAVHYEVWLEPNKTEEDEFVLELDEAGEHVLEVSSNDTSDKITVMVEDEPDEGILSDYWWSIVLLLIVMAAVVVLIFVRKGKKEEKYMKTPSSENPPPPPPEE